ncbi:MAG: NuoM family protein [Candidatus Methylomirabilales bacterium]
MTLLLLVLLPLAGGLAAWIAEHRSAAAARLTALGTLSLTLGAALAAWLAPAGGGAGWRAEAAWEWIPRFGIRLHLALDGLSLLLVLLSLGVGILAVLASWSEVRERVGLFHACLLWTLAGILGVFLAVDLFLFYVCWELMLVPMYFLIGVWGHGARIPAAIKFFLFTQASGLLMLVAILGLVAAHAAAGGPLTFAYGQLLGTPLEPWPGRWLFLGFFVAFAVKLPAVPFHTWLPDAHAEAPTAGSVLLAGLMLKTGAYGLLRFAVPLFPEAAAWAAPAAMALGVGGILYGAVLAFAQADLKRLVAYTSVSHMGFVLLAIFAGTATALQGAVLEIICHALSTGALFILAGALQERLHTRDLAHMGGLWAEAPRLGGATLFFAMASLGLPGLGNFAAEFLILVGTFRASPAAAAAAAAGLVLAAVYALQLVQAVVHGPNRWGWRLPDLTGREMTVVGALVVALLVLGLAPQPVLEAARPSLETLQRASGGLR